MGRHLSKTPGVRPAVTLCRTVNESRPPGRIRGGRIIQTRNTPGDPLPTLSSSFVGRDNALGLIRLVLASMVIVSHSFPTSGVGDDPFGPWAHGQQNFGGLAVIGFFALSGYLITKSGRNSDILQFLWHRFIRIFPAFWVVLIVGAFVVGPIVWVMGGQSLGSYFTLAPNGPFGYLAHNWTLTMNQLGVYDLYVGTTPYGDATGISILNGSLWTLAYEWSCYLIIAALVLFGVLTRARGILLGLTALYFGLEIVRLASPETLANVIPFINDPVAVDLTFVFLVGACFASFAEKIPFDYRLAILSAFVIVITLHYGGFAIVAYPAVCYLLLWLATRLPTPLRRIGRVNDYSYGVYLYGFLAQQFFAFLGLNQWGYVPFTIAVFIAAFGCAWLSWHLIEKQAMKLKHYGPGRGYRYWISRLSERFAGRRVRA
jgi:peptidoglycan/LPS O-acetylase OafA/YrhL